ncbi:putative Gag-pol polyprotein, partial [Gregarina niphandrodes]
MCVKRHRPCDCAEREASGLDKSEWLKPEVKNLGHKIGRQGIACQERRIGNVLNAPAPASRKELQRFLGAVGYLRLFIPRFAEYTAPLFELLKKGRLFVWSDARGEAFMELKQAVAGASLLHKPVPGAPLIIEIDASEVGIGAVLKQVQEGREVPLEFASKKFTDAERKWYTRERALRRQAGCREVVRL